MSQLPKNWKSTQLKNLLSFVLGGDWGKDSDYQNDDFETVFCIRGTEFKNWSKEKGITSVERKVKKASAQKRALQLGDILVEISGGGPEQPVGRTVLIDEDALKHNPDFPKVCTNFIRLARPSDTIDSRYLNYYLRSFYASGEVVNYQGGSNNLRNLKFKEYETIEVPVAPSAEQKLIANKLDSILGKVETAQARLDKIPTLLKRFRQSVLAAATSGELTKDWREDNEVENWQLIKVGTIVEKIEAGKNIKCQERPPKENEFGIIKISAVTWGAYNEEQSKTLNDISLFLENRRVQIGDFLISRANTLELLGMPVIVHQTTKNLMLSDKVLRLVMNETNKEWLNIFLRSSLGRKEIESRATGNQQSMRNIGQKALLDIDLQLPSETEKSEIVRCVTELFSSADLVEKQYKAAKLRVDKMTQSILSRAFSGKLFSPISEDDRETVVVKTQNSQPKQTKSNNVKVTQTEEKDIFEKNDAVPESEVVYSSAIENHSEQTGEVFKLLKNNKKGMSAQALFDELSDNTFSAIDDLFSELKKLIEQRMVIQAGEGENSTFKVTKK